MNLALQHCDEVALQHCDEVALQHCDEVALQLRDEVALQHCDEVALQHCAGCNRCAIAPYASQCLWNACCVCTHNTSTICGLLL
jgi:hypothetical protein